MQRFANKKILVTGATGFIGSHLSEALLNEGGVVTGVDNFVSSDQTNLKFLNSSTNFTFIEADVSHDPETYLKTQVFDFIFHFASPASPPFFRKFAREIYLVNSIGTDHLLQYLKQTNPQGKFIYAGSSEAYGDPLEHPQKESYWGNVNPNGPRSCYDESKRLGETICGVHQREFGLDTRIVRIFNTYGPRMNPKDGRVLTNFVSQALAQEPLTIHGDGQQTRSYCYVSDLVEGILRLAESDLASGATVNLGNPNEFTILQTAQLVWQTVHGAQEPQFTFTELPIDDPARRQPDISQAKQLLNWQPEIEFVNGLKMMVEYFKNADF